MIIPPERRKHPELPDDNREPIDEPYLPDDPGSEPEGQTTHSFNSHGEYAPGRYVLGRCLHGYHDKCPEVKLRERYERVRIAGKWVYHHTGRSENVYCECPCHGESHGK